LLLATPLHDSLAMRSADFRYVPRRPVSSVLYGVVAGELETFLARQQEHDRPVPKFVEDEFRSFLECCVLGLFGYVANPAVSTASYSPRVNGAVFAPSCGGRRMGDTAAYLVDHVFPIAPVRQWVLPFPLRYRLAYDSSLLKAVLNISGILMFPQRKSSFSENPDVSPEKMIILPKSWCFPGENHHSPEILMFPRRKRSFSRNPDVSPEKTIILPKS